MKHRSVSGQKCANVRVSFDMLPRGVQRGDRIKQVQIMYRMLKKQCNIAGVVREMNEHEYYVKPGEKKRKARLLAQAVARGEVKDKSRPQERSLDDYTY
jgi:ribosomal protein S21